MIDCFIFTPDEVPSSCVPLLQDAAGYGPQSDTISSEDIKVPIRNCCQVCCAPALPTAAEMALQASLLDSLFGTNRGANANAEVRAEINELISQLEAKNPTPAPNEVSVPPLL